MIKDIRKARREFKQKYVHKNGKLRRGWRDAVSEILEYKSPLRLKRWERIRGSWWLLGDVTYQQIITLLQVMGCSYKITNDSSTGKNAADDVIHISPRGLIRAKSILKDYNLSIN